MEITTIVPEEVVIRRRPGRIHTVYGIPANSGATMQKLAFRSLGLYMERNDNDTFDFYKNGELVMRAAPVEGGFSFDIVTPDGYTSEEYEEFYTKLYDLTHSFRGEKNEV